MLDTVARRISRRFFYDIRGERSDVKLEREGMGRELGV